MRTVTRCPSRTRAAEGRPGALEVEVGERRRALRVSPELSGPGPTSLRWAQGPHGGGAPRARAWSVRWGGAPPVSSRPSGGGGAAGLQP
eukprot:15472144-Alexandrium_andersonii.AAC.1